jgi:hypothetical protein
MSKTLYYAVNGNGQGVVYTSYPARDDNRKIWVGNIEGLYCTLVMQCESEELLSLPLLKWSDNPVKLELNITVC